MLQELRECERVWLGDDLFVVPTPGSVVAQLLRAHALYGLVARAVTDADADADALPLAVANEMLWAAWCDRDRVLPADSFETRRFTDLRELELLDYEVLRDAHALDATQNKT